MFRPKIVACFDEVQLLNYLKMSKIQLIYGIINQLRLLVQI